MRKLITIISSVVVVLVITLTIIFLPKKDTKVISYKKNYDITSNIDEEDFINISLLVNNKKSYFVDKSQLKEAYITSSENNEVMPLSLVEIKNLNNILQYNKNKYYDFIFKFKIDFKIETKFIWHIKNACLNLNYNDDLNYEIKIGNISYNKMVENPNPLIGFSNVKAVTTNYKNNTYLSGITFGIRTLTSTPIILKNINVINNSVVTGKEVIKLKGMPNINDFSNITGYDFTTSVKNEKEINTILNAGEVNYFFVPLYYEEEGVINKFPIEFELIVNEKEVTEYFYNYAFYEIMNENINKEDVNIYTIK